MLKFNTSTDDERKQNIPSSIILLWSTFSRTIGAMRLTRLSFRSEFTTTIHYWTHPLIPIAANWTNACCWRGFRGSIAITPTYYSIQFNSLYLQLWRIYYWNHLSEQEPSSYKTSTDAKFIKSYLHRSIVIVILLLHMCYYKIGHYNNTGLFLHVKNSQYNLTKVPFFSIVSRKLSKHSPNFSGRYSYSFIHCNIVFEHSYIKVCKTWPTIIFSRASLCSSVFWGKLSFIRKPLSFRSIMGFQKNFWGKRKNWK